MFRTLSVALIFLLPIFFNESRADATLVYRISGESNAYEVLTGKGFVLIPGIAEGGKTDLLYIPQQQIASLINHHKQQYMVIDQKKLDQLANQLEMAQPLLQGLGAQIKHLDPKQQEKWKHMLGGVDLADVQSMDKAPLELKPLGTRKSVMGLNCEQIEVRQSGKQQASLCLASREALKLSEEDYSALRHLLAFTAQISDKARGLAQKFLGPLPGVNLDNLQGIPVMLTGKQGKKPQSMNLQALKAEPVSLDRFQIPLGYQEKKLRLW